MNMNVEIDTLRGQFNVSSTNNSKESFMYLSILSVPYVERIQALNNSFFQTDQVKNNES